VCGHGLLKPRNTLNTRKAEILNSEIFVSFVFFVVANYFAKFFIAP
jgi:hypothetical protein